MRKTKEVYNRDLEYKIELLKECSNSREIYQSLDDVVSQYYHECNDDSLAVDDEPYCGPWYIERHIELLSDLREYTECVRNDQDIPENLTYINDFWKSEDE